MRNLNANKFRGIALFNLLSFILSPILVVPSFVKNAFELNRNHLFLFASVVGLFSYYYFPPSYFDKVIFYHSYDYYRNLDVSSFFLYLTNKADFIFYLLYFLSAKLNIGFHFTCFLLTTLTIYLYASSFKTIQSQFTIKNLLFFIIILSLAYLFSGIRFYLACAFLIGAIASYSKEKKLMSFILTILAIFTHFATIALVLFIIFGLISNLKFLKYLVFISFLVTFVFSSLFTEVLQINLLGSAITKKIEIYLGSEDVVLEQINNGSVYYVFKLFFTEALRIFMVIYFLTRCKVVSLKTRVFGSVLILLNLVSSYPFILLRYELVFVSFFLLLIISEESKKRVIKDKLIKSVAYVLLFGLFLLDISLIYPSIVKHNHIFQFISPLSIFVYDIPDYPLPTY